MMDTDASTLPTVRVDGDLNEVFGFFLKIENTSFPSPIKHKNTVMKYTKLPDFDYDSIKVPVKKWSENSYNLQPRLRRIVMLEDPTVISTRSLKTNVIAPLVTTASSTTRRKIVTITEDDESDLHPKFSRDPRRYGSVKTTSKAAATENRNEKQYTQKTSSRLTNSSRYSKENQISAKIVNTSNRKENNVPKTNNRNKFSNINQSSADASKARPIKEKDPVRNPRSNNVSSKISISKNSVAASESEKEISLIKNKLLEKTKTYAPQKKPELRPYLHKSKTQSPKKIFTEMKGKNKSAPIIYVPFDVPPNKEDLMKHITVTESTIPPSVESKVDVQCGIDANDLLYTKHANIETDPPPTMTDKVTEMQSQTICMCSNDIDEQSRVIKTTFDSLAIPNVTLTKEKQELTDDVVRFHSKSLPNFKMAPLKVTAPKEERIKEETNYIKTASYIIGHATVTCTTRQKINFHVVGSSNETSSNQSTSPLTYPLNVVSIFEKEMQKTQHHDSHEQKDKSAAAYANCLNEFHSLNCSYVFNSNKLVKPSDIISTIRVNNGLLQSEYICEQFQRELNFIDSFFESLQYLESCSLSDKFPDNKVKSLINTEYDVKNSEYSCFLSNLENGADVDDTETMASKSLCLLNLLIRDEQRRAKNLLFVLKMREDALKDFTKSQILWLENKKKQDNTDISTLKKKQRGALLKLQHECGEMQRMRKALLSQSEKRKVALMKTKKNIELKLKNSVDVEQILLGKKKLKRNVCDRYAAPMKCFDLSSSGCEESLASKQKPEIPLPEVTVSATSIASAEKCIQTSDAVESAHTDQECDPAAEHFVAVDGGFLNILFHNISLPQIFSSSKQYEVNEEALKNILSSSNSNCNLNETDLFDKFMPLIKNPDVDSSTPSTARSLVEELDQYYKGLTEGDRSPPESPQEFIDSYSLVHNVNDMLVQATDCKLEQCNSRSLKSASTMTSESENTVTDYLEPFFMEKECVCKKISEEESCQEKEPPTQPTPYLSQAGPLPVPAGSSASNEAYASIPFVKASSYSDSSQSSQPICHRSTSISSLASPVLEAEELRRQQLAIEKEIKALEQQQCQLLVVREIPDKPPPPYTPPADSRLPKQPRLYIADETTEEKITKYITDPNTESCDPTDPFDTFVKDFCVETLERHKSERSDEPWDACNLLPQKPVEDAEKIIKNTSSNLLEILTGVPSSVVSGVGARRSDHIDDILFAEWRRCEPEWTSLHTDETIVKSQIFESIFQKILTETVDEYKRTVVCNQ